MKKICNILFNYDFCRWADPLKSVRASEGISSWLSESSLSQSLFMGGIWPRSRGPSFWRQVQVCSSAITTRPAMLHGHLLPTCRYLTLFSWKSFIFLTVYPLCSLNLLCSSLSSYFWFVLIIFYPEYYSFLCLAPIYLLVACSCSPSKRCFCAHPSS